VTETVTPFAASQVVAEQVGLRSSSSVQAPKALEEGRNLPADSTFVQILDSLHEHGNAAVAATRHWTGLGSASQSFHDALCGSVVRYLKADSDLTVDRLKEGPDIPVRSSADRHVVPSLPYDEVGTARWSSQASSLERLRSLAGAMSVSS
jgi:hypothetical protein